MPVCDGRYMMSSIHLFIAVLLLKSTVIGLHGVCFRLASSGTRQSVESPVSLLPRGIKSAFVGLEKTSCDVEAHSERRPTV